MNACPVCGHRGPHEPVGEYLACAGCCELLAPHELVRRATRRTRRRYERAQTA